MPASDTPAAEVTIDAPLVRRLLDAQHPDLADQPLEVVANGWDNVLVRLGEDLVVRLPRRAQAVPLVTHEHRWLPELAPLLPLPIPVPVRTGAPGQDFPWPWTIAPWFAGETALASPPVDPFATAEALGAFLAALHEPGPADAPANPYRGVPLRDRAEQFERNLIALGSNVDGARLRSLWNDLATAPEWDGPALWVHGDIHPGNLVVRDGVLAAVVDFGDLTAGDRVSDLVVAWMLFDSASRTVLRDAAGARRPLDDASWARAQAWALALGVAIAANSADNPAYAGLAARTIDAVVADT